MCECCDFYHKSDDVWLTGLAPFDFDGTYALWLDKNLKTDITYLSLWDEDGMLYKTAVNYCPSCGREF